ncbi:MAG: pilus assembly protein TadG-related protein [Anaerolineae bacterium]|jgi:hypothetical protein|nr:pilus assembly protein TadG-related protein [Anaerolineae bacterium]
MQALVRRLFRHLRQRGETGQSIILLAIGFVALAGFVGITVDVSLAFVRYAQLSRAVDSAAIAAANQMRQDRTLATVNLAARQFIEFHGLNPEQIWVDTCLTQPGDRELCTFDQAKLVRVRAFVKSQTVFMRLLGVQSFDLVAAAVSQTAALDVVIIMDVSESMASDTTYMDWAQTETVRAPGESRTVTNWGVIYRPPTSVEILRNMGLSDTDVNTNMRAFWETGFTHPTAGNVAGLLNTQQVNVNERLTYVAASGSTAIPGEADDVAAYRVQFNDNFFNSTRFPGQTFGQIRHPREDCRVRFYPLAETVNTTRRYFGYTNASGQLVNINATYAEAGMPWGTLSNNFNAFIPTYMYYDCCNDPNNNRQFDDLNCQPFKDARDATFDFLERIDFFRGDRAAIVTFDRSAFAVNPYPSATRRGPMIEEYGTAYNALRDLIGVRAEPNFYVWDPAAGDWEPNVLAAGIAASGASRPVNYNSSTYRVVNTTATTPSGAMTELPPEAHNYPVFDNCPFGNAAHPNNDRTLFDNAIKNMALPNELAVPAQPAPAAIPPGYSTNYYTNAGRDPNWVNYGVPPFRLIDNPTPGTPLQPGNPGQRGGYLVQMAYEFWASCRNGNVGAALREANNVLLNPGTVRRFGTIWVMVLLSDGAAGASDPVRRNGFKLPEAAPYLSRSSATPFTYGIPGEYGAFGLCPVGTPANPGELANIPDYTPGGPGIVFPFCSDEDPRTRYTCDFRPLRTLADYPGQTPEQRRDALKDAGYREQAAIPAGELPAGATAEDVLAWNRQRGNVYDVDIANCQLLYDVDDYTRDWADYISLQQLTGSAVAQLPTIFTIGFGLGYTNPVNLAGTDIRTSTTQPVSHPSNHGAAQTWATELCQRNVANCLGEQMLRYIADAGDNNQIDNDYWQDAMEEWYNYTGTGPTVNPGQGLIINGRMVLTDGDFGERDPCQTDEGPALINVGGVGVESYDANNDGTLQPAERERLWGSLGPNRSCGNYFYAPGRAELQIVFDEIASRMFTRLSR